MAVIVKLIDWARQQCITCQPRRQFLATAVLVAVVLLCTQGRAQRSKALDPEPGEPGTARRLALVIGNRAYPWKPLVNPINDALDVAAALERDGFAHQDIKIKTDVTATEMRRAVREFIDSVKSGDFAFVYYSGHGVEIKGTNYLLPVDIPADATEGYVEDEAVSAQRIVGDLESQGAAVKILILDACRDNPLRTGTGRTTSGGLAPMEGQGYLVVFATEAGRIASDNTTGRNGLFTQYLLRALAMKDTPFDDAIRDVSRQMAADTNHQQIPAMYGLLESPVILVSGPAIVNVNGAQSAPQPDLEAWNGIKDSKNPQDYEDFVKAYPQSAYATPAMLVANKLKRGAAEARTAAPTTYEEVASQPLATPVSAGVVPAVGQQMQPYSSDEGRFSVQFPSGEVKHDTESVKLNDGASSTLHEFWVAQADGNVSYMVIYNDYPPNYTSGDPQTFLANTRDGAVKGDTVLSDMAISLNGVPGREFSTKDDKWNYTMRQFLKGNRLYQLIIVSNPDHPATQTSDFLDSFRIE
jgi:hypothetical protein